MLSAVSVPKGTTLVMSLLAANHNKDLWGEDASEWKPERWLSVHGGPETGPESCGSEPTADKLGSKNGIKYPGVYVSMWVFVVPYILI